MFSYPLLLADIGGTNARFAIASAPGASLSRTYRLATAAFPSLQAAVEYILAADQSVRPDSMLICAAGPIAQRSVQLTNSRWNINGPELARQLGLAQGLLLNDFEALALTLPGLRSASVMKIGPIEFASGDAVRLVTGPGTGLGVAGLLTSQEKHTAVASEGGHMSLASWSDESAEILARLRKRIGRVSAEAVLSGPGLVRLHVCRLDAHGQRSAVDRKLDAETIVEQGLQSPEGECAETLRMFLDGVASFAGDLALCFAAAGGVTLAGGILPRLRPLLDAKRFRDCFENKAPMYNLCSRIGTQLLIDDEAILHGLREVADSPHRFVLDYGHRCWVD